MPNRNSPNQPGSGAKSKSNYTPVKGTPTYYKGGDGQYYSYATGRPIPKPSSYSQPGVGEFDTKTGALIRGSEAGGSSNYRATGKGGDGGGSGGSGGVSQSKPASSGSSTPAGEIKKSDPGRDAIKSMSGAGGLNYPVDLFTSTTDYIQFEIDEFNAKGSGGGDIGIVRTYMPRNLTTGYAQNWGEATLTPNGRIALNAIGMAIREGEAGKGKVGQYLKSALQGSQYTFAAGRFASGVNKLAPGTDLSAQSILGLGMGLGINNTVEVYWSGHGGLRMMNFSITMNPKSEKEAAVVRDIVKTFKIALHPASQGSNGGSPVESRFVTYPYMVTVKYMSGSGVHPYLNLFFPAALVSMDVNYTPDGNYSTLPNKSPSCTVLTLNLKELRLIYRDDILSGGGASY